MIQSPGILAIDTATSLCSVAVSDPNGRIAFRSISTDRRHNEILPALVEDSLGEVSMIWRQLKAIVVSIGPGSFTGLRVGVSFAKGAALALDIPLIPVSTLKLLAESFFHLPHQAERFVALIPARKGESFAQVFRRFENRIEPEGAPFLVNAEDVLQLAEKDLMLVGEGVDQFARNLIAAGLETKLIPDVVPSPIVLLRFGAITLDSGEWFPAVSEIEPVYLKEFTVKLGKDIK